MNIEIRGADFINKGGELMILSIVNEVYKRRGTDKISLRLSVGNFSLRNKYKIYHLGGGPAWEAAVNQALAAGDVDGARAILEREILAGEAGARAWKTLGSIRVAAGDTVAAINALSHAMKRDTSDVEIPLTLSNLQLEMGDFDSALEQLEHAELLASRDPLIFHNKAVVYLSRARSRFKDGDLAAARVDWRAAHDQAGLAMKFAPGDPDMTEIAEQVDRMGRRWGFVQQR